MSKKVTEKLSFQIFEDLRENSKLGEKRNLKKIMKHLYTFEKTITYVNKNSTVCAKNVRLPAPRKEVQSVASQ